MTTAVCKWRRLSHLKLSRFIQGVSLILTLLWCKIWGQKISKKIKLSCFSFWILVWWKPNFKIFISLGDIAHLLRVLISPPKMTNKQMSQSRQFFRSKPTDGISCVPVSTFWDPYIFANHETIDNLQTKFYVKGVEITLMYFFFNLWFTKNKSLCRTLDITIVFRRLAAWIFMNLVSL